MNAPDATKDIIAAIDLLQTEIVTAINSINTIETVSRTIYVETTGNDTTGNGSIGLPFATIGKALSTIKKNIGAGITITINLGIGTFIVNANEVNILSQITGNGNITIQGTLTLVDSGFTMGAAEALDPLTYAVSGGNTASWTLDQWKFCFLKSVSNYYPITANALTPSLSVISAVTGTEIYQAQTVLSYGQNDLFANISITFLNVKHLYNATINYLGSGIIAHTQCLLETASTFVIMILTPYQSSLQCFRTSFNKIVINSPSSLSFFSNCFCYMNTNKAIFSLTGTNLSFNGVIENPNTGAIACGFLHSSKVVNLSFLSPIKFQNTYAAFKHGNSGSFSINISNFLILKTTSYVSIKQSGVSDYKNNFEIKFQNDSTIYNIPLVRWFFDNMYEFVNMTTGRYIKIPSILYPEFEQNLSAVLANNATTQVIVGNKLQNETITIDYEVKRAGYRKGSFDIINNGAALTQSTDVFITDGTADVSGANVVITVNYNVNEIRCAFALSNAVAGTVKYNVSRKMITPLTI